MRITFGIWKQGIARIRRLFFKHIESCAGNDPPLESINEGGFLNDFPSRGVDDESCRLHQFQFSFPDQPLGLVGYGNVEGKEVGSPDHLIHALGDLDGRGSKALWAHIRVIGPDLHPESMDADLSDDPAYPAQPDQSNSFSRKTDRFVFESRFEIPFSRLAVQIKKLLGEGAHEGCGMFCDKAILGAFDTANDHVVFSGSLDIDVVQTTSRARDHFEAGRFLDHRTGDLGGGSEDKGFGIRDQASYGVVGRVRADNDLHFSLKDAHPGFINQF